MTSSIDLAALVQTLAMEVLDHRGLAGRSPSVVPLGALYDHLKTQRPQVVEDLKRRFGDGWWSEFEAAHASLGGSQGQADGAIH